MFQRRRQQSVTRAAAAAFGALIAIAVLVLVVPLPAPLSQTLKVGDRAPRNLFAAHDATFVSQAATDAAREEAAAKVDPQSYAEPANASTRDTQVTHLNQFLAQVAAIRARSDLSTSQKIEQVNILGGAAGVSNDTRATLVAISDAEFAQIRTSVSSALPDIMSKPILPAPAGQSQSDATDKLVRAYLTAHLTGNPSVAEYSTAVAILDAFVVPNSKVDTAAFKAAQQAARQQVTPVRKTLTRGQAIAVQGEQLNADQLEQLRQTGVITGGYDFWDFAGGGTIAALLGLALALYVWRFQPFVMPIARRMALVGLTIIAILAVVRILFPVLTPDTNGHYLIFAVPVAAAAMVAAAFGDLAFGAIVAVLAGVFATFIGSTLPELAGSSFTSTLQPFALVSTYVASGLAGAIAVARAERLGRYALAAIAIAGVAAAVMVAFWLIGTPRSNVSLGWIAVAAGINGSASAAIALTVFVLLAMGLGITTRLQLLELTQSDNPLLRRLQDEAPGTYHHSMMVGTLAERGATRIGADALLARAGAYYHDIGKLAHPKCYVENSVEGEPSPHDGLSYEESARIIRNHVLVGIDMARRYRLPDPIRAFIPEHHGTRLVTFFYRKAVQANPDTDPAPFRYSGPRPQTRETAIVMLADSCEAVVRARQGEGHDQIDATVDAVFAERLAEGQLDECDITLHELQEVAASFKASLRAVYHPRVAYPDPTPEELAGLARGDSLPGFR